MGRETVAITISSTFAVVLVILLVTSRNWIVSILALLCIGCIMACVCGTLWIAGWELAFFNSICICMSVGFTCDFVFHVAHMYVTAAHEGIPSSFERTNAALMQMGSSVTAAAVSTILAGGTMFLCKFSMYLI